VCICWSQITLIFIEMHGTTTTKIIDICLLFESLSRKYKCVWLKSCRNSALLYLKNHLHLWQYLSEFFLKWEMCQTKVTEKIKTNVLYPISLLSENRHVGLSVYPSAWNNSAPSGRILIEFCISTFFRKSVYKIQVSVKYSKTYFVLHKFLPKIAPLLR
jgi:hypothetical protein